MQLALLQPESISDQYVEVMKGKFNFLFKKICTIFSNCFVLKAFYKLPHKKPKFINQNSNSINELDLSKHYPLLKPLMNWTRNEQKYCSSYNSNVNKDLVTNLIDGLHINCICLLAFK